MNDARVPYDACPLCGSPAIRTLLTADCSGHPLYDPKLPANIVWCTCDACGHIFTDGSFTEEAFEILFSKTHDHQMAGHDMENQRFVSARIVEKVAPFATPGPWLDVGFGNASLLLTAAEFGFEPVGIDLREGNVAALRGLDIEAHCVDLGALDQPGRFRVISMADVLEHMRFPAEGLIAARNLLASDGVLFVSMPNADSALWKALDRDMSNPYWGEIEHFHNFGRRRLYRLLADFGFEPVQFGISERYRVCMEVIAVKTANECGRG